MDDQSSVDGIMAALERLPDDDLEKVIAKGQAVQEQRAEQRKQTALEEIRKIAKEHGLDVAVKPKRRRGRPKKDGD